jgi:hypothetical protein
MSTPYGVNMDLYEDLKFSSTLDNGLIGKNNSNGYKVVYNN